MLVSKDAEENRQSINEKIEEINAQKTTKVDENLIAKIKENVEREYRYEEDAHIPARVSVSNLKKSKLEEDNDIVEQKISDVNEEEITEEFRKPEVLEEKTKSYTAVRKGLLIHFILQNLDFSSLTTVEDIKQYIEKLTYENVISKQDQKYINPFKIYKFLNSSIGKELKKSNEIYREYEFILEDSSISNSLIQGIIDLFFVTSEKKVILVDFKTDRLESEQEFIKRYKIQLDIYKKAINSLTKYNVDSTYIYSFNLDKEIEIKEEEDE